MKSSELAILEAVSPYSVVIAGFFKVRLYTFLAAREFAIVFATSTIAVFPENSKSISMSRDPSRLIISSSISRLVRSSSSTVSDAKVDGSYSTDSCFLMEFTSVQIRAITSEDELNICLLLPLLFTATTLLCLENAPF